MGATALVIGGTGPTGIPLVRGLVDAGYAVTILHRGTHERPETPAAVRHVHRDPYDDESLRAAFDGDLAGVTHDVVFAMYGRLRRIAQYSRGRTGRFISVGGVPAYRGWMNPWVTDPPGMPVPVSEDAPLVRDPADDPKGYRIVQTEAAVFAHHPSALHFRYPYVYGPHQLVPREWLVVRRILDGRTRLIVADDGLTLHHHGFSENLAHALLLAASAPDSVAGLVFNVGDEEVLSIRQVVELIAGALAAPLELISMPYDLAVPARPLLAQPLPSHRVLDLSRLRAVLGYRDAVPARVAIARTAQWLVENRPAPGGTEEQVLTDPFDYEAEDRLIAAWERARAGVAVPEFAVEPGYGMAYSGPGGRPRSQPEFTP